MLVKFKANHTVDGTPYNKDVAVEIDDEKLKAIDPADYEAAEEVEEPKEKAPAEPKADKAVKKASKK